MKNLRFALCFAFIGATLLGQNRFDKVTIKTIPVTDRVAMLQGAGGNIGVCYGEDGVFMIDDQFAPLTEKIRKAIAELSPKEIKFVINTHWHGDHTGGNENLGKAGSVIVAHENVRKRVSTKQMLKAFNREVPASPKAALPVITFTRDMAFHLNGEEIKIHHMAHAHTDGDAIIHFLKTNVIHMGDIFFVGKFPFIDGSSGGNINGVIKACEQALGMANNQTKIIPGHGDLATKADLAAYRDMLVTVRDRVAKMIKEGKSLADIQAAGTTKEYDDEWGNGFIKPDFFINSVYEGLVSSK